ncbi:Voltage-gated Ion Channel (VIC) Superfamily [Phytophthora infestans T30-4]|uniref:Voltage-gated Ion Channel (VIC) Superfamily n=1 Tax=Phytophthora infestans (strain T30-4) TaxID=403677 RepID=D0MQ55_PHYIT|nr:Voltage-gated Ion Channel (VIC) Superfamily [Phytophthora infestans T30-4]EEY57624.1 Voltage-gated Ion Channel (VIC) Superfamily [Phytophthora infestans T30-4]|eukprot:XP_002908810.1 Voltage-gated Ion Channel (VIC) Superfamily [Phytophthora infestans T30-4]
MGMICVNQNEEANFTTSTPRCVADWAHTQEQVTHASYLLAGLLLISLLWTVTSRRQRKSLRKGEVGFSLNCRRWARTSRTAAIINRPVQLLVSFGILGLTMSRLNSYDVTEWSYYTVLGLYIVAIVDDVVRFLASRYKLLFCFSPLTLLELLCLASNFGVGFGTVKVIGGVRTRTYLDFSVMRPVFILRSYLEMDKNVPRSTKGWMMVRLGIKILLMIMVGASIMFFFETLGEMPFFTGNGFAHLYSCSDGSVTRHESSECSDSTWSVMFAFYFTVVTLGTVGYGDNAPQTVPSRLLAIMFIVMGIILFSMEIDNLISLYKLRQIGNPPYTPKPDSKHVLIIGNPSFAQLSAILRELFHVDHISDTDTQQLEAVVLGEHKSKFTKPLVAKLKADPIFTSRVTYIAGNATRSEDLERALARDARAVFVFPDKLTGDAATEDAMNIMRVLATKRYVGSSVRFLVLVLRAESARHMLAAGVHPDDIICENVIKMGSLAQNTVSNGISTMLSNLGSSLSVDTNKSMGPDILTTDVAERDLSERSWIKEYYAGAAKEMYLIHLSKVRAYAGLTFSQAATRVFRETSGTVLLIGVEPRVLLNPGESLLMTEWIQCYCIADDLDHVFNYKICPEEVSLEEMRRPGSTSTFMNPKGDVFQPILSADHNDDDLPCDELRSLTAYTAYMTPNYDSMKHRSPVRSLVLVRLDRSLESIALNFKNSNQNITSGNPYDNPQLRAAFHSEDASRNSAVSKTLPTPSLDILLHPNHIVICSFLGEDSLESLQWLILPLRSPYAVNHPPITILDSAEPSEILMRTLSAFKNVYYVRGSPLVYSDLQRAGAKAAAAVVVLGKRTKNSISSESAADAELESSIADAEAIFATMLVELKMDFSKIFTVTELANEVNSKFMGMSFQLNQLQHLWDQILQHEAPEQKSEKEIFGLPLYMSGRILHPELCENMAVQTYFNPSIHKIVRQLVGGPRCTGVIHTFSIPLSLRDCTYANVFHTFASSSYSGICIGIYRMSTQAMGTSHQVELPIVITTPKAELEILSSDRLFVLIGAHTLERAATRIQKRYRNYV